MKQAFADPTKLSNSINPLSDPITEAELLKKITKGLKGITLTMEKEFLTDKAIKIMAETISNKDFVILDFQNILINQEEMNKLLMMKKTHYIKYEKKLV